MTSLCKMRAFICDCVDINGVKKKTKWTRKIKTTKKLKEKKQKFKPRDEKDKSEEKRQTHSSVLLIIHALLPFK